MKQKLHEKVQRIVDGALAAASRAEKQAEAALAAADEREKSVGEALAVAQAALVATRDVCTSLRDETVARTKEVLLDPVAKYELRLADIVTAAHAAIDEAAKAAGEKAIATRREADDLIAKVNGILEAQITLQGDAEAGLRAAVEAHTLRLREVREAVQACRAAYGAVKDAAARLAPRTIETAPADTTEQA